MNPAALLLADGSRFDGIGLDHQGLAIGEAVFYTGMTGYEEALTDPSYAGQILNFTYPMIGNYGISGVVSQHARACVAGVVMKRIAAHPCHWQMQTDLGSWLNEQKIPTITDIDTRALTIALREHGTIMAALAVGELALAAAEQQLAKAVREATTLGLVASVVNGRSHALGSGDGPRITLLDCGVKRAILTDLLNLGARVTVLPYNASREQILATTPHGLFISPGPGDPTDLASTILTLKSLIGELPLFGVCLGHQLLALACGAKTFKLPYGHRGGNQPVKDLRHNRVLVTAHNHGYAVDINSLPAELEATMVNLNDHTNEGFAHRSLPIAAVQFHPEASPGPLDAKHLFAEWINSLVVLA